MYTYSEVDPAVFSVVSDSDSSVIFDPACLSLSGNKRSDLSFEALKFMGSWRTSAVKENIS